MPYIPVTPNKYMIAMHWTNREHNFIGYFILDHIFFYKEVKFSFHIYTNNNYWTGHM